MLNIYLEIGQHIFDLMPEIEWIDRDKGQIDNEEDFFSILTPAVLLEFGEINWVGLSRGSQLGEMTITTKLISVKPPETFSRGSAPLQEYAVLNMLADRLHATMGELVCIKERRRSSDYFTKNWYVIEQQYDMEIEYEVPVITAPKPRPNIKREFINLNIQNK